MRQVFFSIIIVLMLAVLIFLVATLPTRIVKPKEQASFLTSSSQMDYANKLLSKGLKSEAAEAFEEYLASGKMQPQEEAKLLYKLGSVYMELYKYEKALKSFYKAEMLDPKAEFSGEMNQKIVEALENLGMSSQARYELEARTSLGGEKQAKGKVVARIGKREITDAEIDEALKNVPQWMRKSLEEPERRQEFIRNYVGQEVLYTKARRLGLDTKEETRKTLEQLKKQIVVEQFLGNQIQEKLDKISPEDIKLYYEAKKDSFTELAQIKVAFLSFENESQKDEMIQKLKEKEGKPQEASITEGDTSIAGIGEAKDIIASLFLKEKGQISDPLKIKDKFYVFSVIEKRQKRQKSFEEVKSEVEYEYKIKRQQEISQDLLKKALEEQEVEIFETTNKNETKKDN
ncbi:MAG: peptidylprolyl isomerase [Candidatus Omnitrophica bacterium ADurb.Bin205]|nr:MAG: peptidylprolyl isomerase [Candidatus Omnitrophica bacterium ADurb.Bin205]